VTIAHLTFIYSLLSNHHPEVNNKRLVKKKKYFENEIESKKMKKLDLIKVASVV
jgi:hypothetical protein